MLKDEIARCRPEVEAYFEAEVYTERDTRKWDSRRLDEGWQERWPFQDDRFVAVTLPQNQFEAPQAGLALNLVEK